MGREIKRVPANFDWPLGKVWDGFKMPEELWAIPCAACDQQGYNKATKQIADDFYDFERTGRRWVDKITQDEVQALVDAGRLLHFTHTWKRGEGWKRREDGYIPSADEVNAAQSARDLAIWHDAINRGILIEARAKRLGVWGDCPNCGGQGEGWRDAAHHAAHDAWEATEPPTGDWWQVWETVSEGSPVTPAFETAEALIEHLVQHSDAWDQRWVVL
jgi:hypothetical protein